MLNSEHAIVAVSQPKPEWIRIHQAVRLFGLSRSTLYELISSNSIKTSCLRKRNALRGIRLVNYDSLDDYIRLQADASDRSERKEPQSMPARLEASLGGKDL
jgi:hypothetical protein